MKPVPAYITIDGVPLCKKAEYLMDRCSVTCGHVSLADAHRSKRKLQKYRHGIRVVRGMCPCRASSGE